MVVALARAVALQPGDPAAQPELGWAALPANELAQAETVTAQALQQTAGDSELRAARLYIQERPSGSAAARFGATVCDAKYPPRRLHARGLAMEVWHCRQCNLCNAARPNLLPSSPLIAAFRAGVVWYS
jgi:hypothetical protein